MIRAIKGALASLVLALSACGGAVPPPERLPADFQLVTGQGVALGLPPDYTALPVSAEDFRQTADALAESNPALAGRLAAMSDSIAEDTLRLAALHSDGQTSLNITTERVPPTQNSQAQALLNRAGLEAFGYVILETGELEREGKTFATTTASIRLQNPQGVEVVWILAQYTLVRGGRAYSISFGTPRYAYLERRADFERIAATFHTIKD
jgi:hypothetical protein